MSPGCSVSTRRMFLLRSRRGFALVCALLALIGFSSSGSRGAVRAPGGLLRIPVAGYPQPLVADDDAVWVSVGTGDNMLWRIDTNSNTAVALPNTHGAEWPALGEGFAWLTVCKPNGTNDCARSDVLKLDQRTGLTIADIPLRGYALQIATGLGSVWVSTTHGLVRIDPVTGTITAELPVDMNFVGFATGDLWGTQQGRVIQVDPDSGRIVLAVLVHDPCVFEASDAGVWVESCFGGLPPGQGPDILTKLDPTTGEVEYRVPVRTFGALQYDGEWLWLAGTDPDMGRTTIDKLDPTTGLATGEQVQVPPAPGQHGYGETFMSSPFFAIGAGSFWLTHVDASDVVRVDRPL
jgi:hypothetical protein